MNTSYTHSSHHSTQLRALPTHIKCPFYRIQRAIHTHLRHISYTHYLSITVSLGIRELLLHTTHHVSTHLRMPSFYYSEGPVTHLTGPCFQTSVCPHLSQRSLLIHHRYPKIHTSVNSYFSPMITHLIHLIQQSSLQITERILYKPQNALSIYI